MITHSQLTMESPRLFEDFRLREASPARIKEISVVESAYDSVLCADFTYVSTPITSGALLYSVMKQTGVKTLDELRLDKAFFYDNVILPNIQAADSVAQTMLGFGGAVIAPAVFEAKSLGWSQDDYMGLWLDTIENKATRLAMVDGWQYSNGGCEEYLQALLMQAGRRDRNNVSIVDARGQMITHHHAIDLMYDAIIDLLSQNFIPTTLLQVLHRCRILHYMVATEQDYGQLIDQCGKTTLIVGEHYHHSQVGQDRYHPRSEKIRDLLKHYQPLFSPEEQAITSSANLYPGLIRRDEREELTQAKANTKRLDSSEQ